MFLLKLLKTGFGGGGDDGLESEGSWATQRDSHKQERTDYNNGEMQLVCAKALQLTVDIVSSGLLWHPGRSQLPGRKRTSRCLELDA